MASKAPSPLASSTETTNGTKLRRLLVDGGTPVLRKVFDGIHHPTKLASKLYSHRPTLDELCGRGILSKEERELLFPSNGSNPDSKKFDITLLFLLLVEICGLSPPHTGWNNKPHAKTKTLAANLVRIKLFRNKLLHTPEIRIDTKLFNDLWKEISGVLVALGLDRKEIDRLKAEPCGEEDYLEILFKWADLEKDAKLMMKEVRKGQEKMCQTQQEQSALLQDMKHTVVTVCQTQQEQNVLVQDTKQAVETVSQNQQEQSVLLQSTKQAVETVSQTQQKQSVLLQGTTQAVEVVSQTQQEQKALLQDTKQAVETVRQTQQELHARLEEAQQVTDSKMEATHQAQAKTHEVLETFRGDLQEMKQTVSSLEENKEREMEDEILQKLAKSEFKGDIEYHVGRFQEGTREWVFNKIQNWLDDRNSQNRVMVISANAGMGKSVIAAVICKRMQEAGRLSGSHFCQHNNARYRNPQLMLQSLASHLCHASPEYKQVLVKQLSRNLGKDLNNMGVEELFALLFKEPLSGLADPGRDMLMVIDGLDESEYQKRNDVLFLIANHFCKLPRWIRFLCTTRPEKNIAEALKQLKPFQLEPNEEENLKDIKLFFVKNSQCLRPENKDAIVDKVVEKSEGLMLYAHYVVSFFEENVSVLDQGDLDDSLPLAISSVYHSYFKRLENELSMKELGVKQENFLNLLCAVTASREPLPIGFVSKLLVPCTNSLLARRKVLKAIGSVSSLLPIRDGCVHVFHKSVQDWLTDTSCYGEHDFTVDEKQGHRILASLCSDELYNLKQKGVHDTQFSPTEKYALQHGARHMLQLYDNRRSGTCSLEECVQRYVIDLELLYAKLCQSDSLAIEDILWLQEQDISQGLSENCKGLLNTLKFLLRKYFNTFANHPHLIFETVLNKGGTALSPVASHLLQKTYPEIPYMELQHKQMQQGAVLARFQCSSQVACFDVSPQLDYMVCECMRGEKIQLWSLHTGKLVWERRSVIRRPYFYWNAAYRISPSSPGALSFYRSVAFHPTADVVLAGVLSQAYTFDGHVTPLFPESKCLFTVCSVSGDKTKMLTDCPGDAKCIIMWSLENGSEITRTTRNEDVLSFAWSRDEKLLAISHSTGSVCIVNAMDGFRTLGETFIPEVCGMIKFSPDCRSLFCMRQQNVTDVLENRAISRLSLKRNTFRFTINMAEHPCCTLDVCRESYVPWESESHSEAGFLLGDPISSADVAFVLNKQTVLTSNPRNNIIDMLNISELHDTEREVTLNMISDIVFSLNGETVYVVSNADKPTVTAWDVSSGELIGEKSLMHIRGRGYWLQKNRLVSLVSVKEGVLLTTVSGSLELWNFELSKCVRRWTNLNQISLMIPVSEERVACRAENIVIILDTTSGETVSTIPTSHGYLVACNSKCQLLTYSLGFGSLQLTDGKTVLWKRDFDFLIPPIGIFSPSEQFIVVYGERLPAIHEEQKYVLDALTGRMLPILREVGLFSDCKFVSDEECVFCSLATSGGQCLQLFNFKSGDLLSLIDMEREVFCLAACPRKRLLAIEQSDSKHGFKLVQVHLPQDKDSRKNESTVTASENTREIAREKVCDG